MGAGAPIVQWIEQLRPKEWIPVRLGVGAQNAILICMNPEEKKLLQEVVDLSHENNKMLHKMQRAAIWATAFRIFYWLLIIGASVGAFYFFQPYIDDMKALYSGLKETGSGIGSYFNF